MLCTPNFLHLCKRYGPLITLSGLSSTVTSDTERNRNFAYLRYTSSPIDRLTIEFQTVRNGAVARRASNEITLEAQKPRRPSGFHVNNTFPEATGQGINLRVAAGIE